MLEGVGRRRRAQCVEARACPREPRPRPHRPSPCGRRRLRKSRSQAYRRGCSGPAGREHSCGPPRVQQLRGTPRSPPTQPDPPGTKRVFEPLPCTLRCITPLRSCKAAHLEGLELGAPQRVEEVGRDDRAIPTAIRLSPSGVRKSFLACTSEIAGVLPSLAPSPGRFTPPTGCVLDGVLVAQVVVQRRDG